MRQIRISRAGCVRVAPVVGTAAAMARPKRQHRQAPGGHSASPSYNRRRPSSLMGRSVALAFVIVLAAVALGPRDALATTFLVTTTAMDEYDGDCTAEHCTFEEAWDASYQVPDAEIVLPAGIYQMPYGFEFEWSIRISGAGSGSTVVRAPRQGDAPAREATLSFSGLSPITVELTGLTIEGAYAGIYADVREEGTLSLNDVSLEGETNPEYPSDPGWAGIEMSSGVISVIDSRVRGFARYGAYLDDTGDISGALVLRSEVSENGYGGIYSAVLGELIVESSTVANNGWGGGLSAEGGVSVHQGSTTVIDSLIEYNFGSGILSLYGEALRVERSTIRNNVGSEGGGIYFAGMDLVVVDSSLETNIADSHGGGVSAEMEGFLPARFERVTIAGNEAPAAGGLFVVGVMEMLNSTVSSNIANEGGGLWHDPYGEPPTMIRNSTFVGNHATGMDGDGHGGIRTSSGYETVLSNTMIAGNTPHNCGVASSGLLSTGYNIDSDGSCFLGYYDPDLDDFLPAEGDLSGTGDVFLAPLGDYGGLTRTHALCEDVGVPHESCLGVSPAINAASPVIPGSGPGACEEIDQRGVERPVDGRCDIGAYEGGSISPYCGNGRIELDEECDDGNNADGDCCDAECRFEAEGGPCDDGDATTCPDRCDGAGLCLPGSDETHECGTCDDGVDNDGNGAIDCEDPNCCTLGEAIRFATIATRARGKVLSLGSDVSVLRMSVDGTCNAETSSCECHAIGLRGCQPERTCTKDRDCGGGVCGAGNRCVCPTAAVVGCSVAGAYCVGDADCRVDDGGFCNPAAGACACPAQNPTCAALGRLCSHDTHCRLPYPRTASLGGVCAQRGDIRAGSQVDFLATASDMQLGKGRTVGRVLDLGAEFASNGDLRNLDGDPRNDCKPGRCLKVQLGSTPLLGPPVCSSALDLACVEDAECPAAPSDVCLLGRCTEHEEACGSNADCAPACDGRRRLSDGNCAGNPAQKCIFDFECGPWGSCQHPWVSTDGSSPHYQMCAAVLAAELQGRDDVSGALCRAARGIASYVPDFAESVDLGSNCVVCSSLGQDEATCAPCPTNGGILRSGSQVKTVLTLGSGLQVLDLNGTPGGLALSGRTQLVLRGEADTTLVVRIPDRKKLQLGPEAKVYVEGIPAEQVVWVAHGRKGSVKFNRDVHFVGTVLAPERTGIKVGGNSEVNGALFSQKVSIGGLSTIRHLPFRAKLPIDPAANCE